MVKYVELLRSKFPKLGTAPKTRKPPSRAHALKELPHAEYPKSPGAGQATIGQP